MNHPLDHRSARLSKIVASMHHFSTLQKERSTLILEGIIYKVHGNKISQTDFPGDTFSLVLTYVVVALKAKRP